MVQRHPSPPLRSVAAAAVALAVTALPVAASAQQLEVPRPRQGYFLGGGLQFAMARVTDDGDPLGTLPGTILTVHTGEMVTSHLGLGLSLEYGGAADDRYVAALGGLGLAGQWEFARNLALHGSVGFGVVGLEDTKYPNDPRRGSYGGSYSLGLSYDWFPRPKRLSGGWSLQPITMFRYLPDDPISSMVFSLGVEVVRWRGLRRNELDLPAGEGYHEGDKRAR
jgi:hypothetical protein